MKKLMFAAVALAAGAVLTGCDDKKTDKVVPAIDINNMDLSLRPNDDFYHFANGGWITNNPLKPEYSRFGSFDQLAEDNMGRLKSIVEELSADKQEPGSIGYKITTLYNLGMNEEKLNTEGCEPIREQLTKIDVIADRDALTAMIAEIHHQASFPYFSFFVDADEKNSRMNIAIIQQSGLSMGDRDYYLDESEESKALRAEYQAYIEKLFTLAGSTEEQAKAAVEAVLKVENAIAQISYPREVLRDSERNYNKINLDALKSLNTFVNWDLYLSQLGLQSVNEINVSQIEYISALDKAFESVSLDEHKDYLKFKLISAASPYLSVAFVDATFDFFGRKMSGAEEQKPRWRRVLSATDGSLSEGLGIMYVERFFPASSKEKMLELVDNLKVALGQRIASLEWMTDETKAKAQEKLAAFVVKIGYPDKWRNYDGLDIDENVSYWENIRRANIFDMDYMYADAGKPVDMGKWYMSPQTVNAYYNPTTNEICFPAGILQPPFFNPNADDAVNYGAIGVVIGHEMTHGFDDQGRNYDKDGNMNNWWNDEDDIQFTERAQKLVEQFNALEVLSGVFANGAYTLGENIADQGGLIIARLAYENSLEGKERPADIDGFNDAQRFYIGYASIWAQNIRDEEIARLTRLDVHSLGLWRVNATLQNVDAFYDAFAIVEGDAMYKSPEDRVLVW